MDIHYFMYEYIKSQNINMNFNKYLIKNKQLINIQYRLKYIVINLNKVKNRYWYSDI